MSDKKFIAKRSLFSGICRGAGFFLSGMGVLSMCLVSVAWAREDSVAEEELATVVVTASRFQEQEREALSATTVITQQTIRNKQLADLASLLRSEAGIEFDRMGAGDGDVGFHAGQQCEPGAGAARRCAGDGRVGDGLGGHIEPASA